MRRPGGEPSIARNAAFAVATQMTTAAFTAALTLYLVRALGPDDYGVFALALGIGTALTVLADVGVTPSAARFIAERRSDRGAVSRIVGHAVRLKAVALLPLSAALVALAGPIASAYDNGDLATPLRLMAIALAGQSAFALFREAFVALGRLSVTWRAVLAESAIEASASVAFVAGGAGAAGAMLGRATGYLTGAALAALLLRHDLRRLPSAGGPEREVGRRTLAAYAGVVFAIDVAFTLFEQIDVILIGAIISTTAVGVFQAPLRLVTFLGYGGQALALAVAPRLARRGASDVRAFLTAARYLLLLQGALVAPVLVWTEPIVHLTLGQDYQGSVAVLRALAPFVFLSGLGTYVTITVNYLGEARRRVPLAVVAVLINAGIDVVLLPSIGVVGGAIGTDVAFGLFAAGHFWICRNALQVPMRPLGATFVRCLLAVGVMAAVLALFGTSSLSPLEWVTGSIAALFAYLVVLRVLGELSRGDLERGRRALVALVGRAASRG